MKQQVWNQIRKKKHKSEKKQFQRIRLKGNDAGMTMVEVLMGFVLLLLIMGMLSGIIALSSNMIMRSVDLRRAEESLQAALYKTSVTGTPVETNLSLVPDTGMPAAAGGGLSFTSAKLYQVSTDTLLDEEAQEESLTMTFYYIK